MKTCPVCQAKAFDDARVCYGCLYRYDDSEPRLDIDCGEGSKQAPSCDSCSVSVGGGEGDSTSQAPHPPGFHIKLVPMADSSGAVTWSCAVELAS